MSLLDYHSTCIKVTFFAVESDLESRRVTSLLSAIVVLAQGPLEQNLAPSTPAGLNLVLNLERDEYMHRGLTSSVGARVSIFPPDVGLLPDVYGFSVSPNTRTDVALSHREFRRLPAPYASGCVGDWDETPFTTTLTDRSIYSIEVTQVFLTVVGYGE